MCAPRRLLASEASNDLPRAHERVLVPGSGERLGEREVHPVGESVGDHVVAGVVDRDLRRIDVVDHRTEYRFERLVVRVYRVLAERLGVRRVVAADDDVSVVLAGDDDERRPDDIEPEQERETGLVDLGCLAGDGEPAVGVGLTEQADWLLDLLADEGRIGHAHSVTGA